MPYGVFNKTGAEPLARSVDFCQFTVGFENLDGLHLYRHWSAQVPERTCDWRGVWANWMRQ
ncbi:hypothetical protein [Pukyongiella litopenaei]|uniref:Uncharacterized protein n=1 Tax=Pukyongiella litopenaei TaxID=2605946 RepID=A0A2S0MQX1_9RHOB|nr:hypothetical protein [Pukyongiella litopenaei]AVO38285.1 hypothetical protein C6Y53_11670 [Pukyongiella litopenaei]